MWPQNECSGSKNQGYKAQSPPCGEAAIEKVQRKTSLEAQSSCMSQRVQVSKNRDMRSQALYMPWFLGPCLLMFGNLDPQGLLMMGKYAAALGHLSTSTEAASGEKQSWELEGAASSASCPS